MYQNFIIPYLYEAQYISGDTPPIIRSLKLHWQPLVLHTCRVVGRLVGGRCQAYCAWWHPPTTRPTTFHVCKTRDCHCSFRLLMMGHVSPKTCWASYKYGIIRYWYIVASCWIFLYESMNIIPKICLNVAVPSVVCSVFMGLLDWNAVHVLSICPTCLLSLCLFLTLWIKTC